MCTYFSTGNVAMTEAPNVPPLKVYPALEGERTQTNIEIEMSRLGNGSGHGPNWVVREGFQVRDI